MARRKELKPRLYDLRLGVSLLARSPAIESVVGGGSLTSEREVRPIPFILVRSERILLNELIHCCMPYFLVHFFLLGPAYLPLLISRVTSYLSCLSEWVLSMLLAFVSEEWPSGVFQKD